MKSEPMDEQRLLAILKEEEADASSYYQSELAEVQVEAWERYFGEKYGNEVEGHPQVVSQDVEDTVNWIIPHLMRLFLANEDLLLVEDEKSDNIEMEQQIADYLEHIFYKDNAGDEIIHDFIQDGLVGRIGLVSVAYEEPKAEPPKIYENVLGNRVEEWSKSPEHEILEAEENEPDAYGMTTFNVKVQKTPAVGKFVVESVPPEEFGIATRSKSIDTASYVRRKQEVYLADLISMFPDAADELDPTGATSISDDVDDLDSDERRQTRFQNENYDHDDQGNTAERKKVDLITEWIRIDYDGDGTVELRQVKRVGNTILENEQVDKCDLVEWSPIRIAHRAIGRSVAEQIFELAKIRTDLMRYLLLNLEQTLSPRTFVGGGQEPDVIDQLLDRTVGDVIEVNGDPNIVIRETVTPDVTPSIYPALQYTDQRAEQSSGVMRHAQGHRDQGVTDTASGIRNLQSAANARIELIGRWAAKGVEKIFERLFELVAHHQNQPRIIRLQGKPMQIDPRGWSEDMTVSLHVGIAAETREEKLNKLMLISQKQEQILQTAGPGNPMVGTREYANTLQDITREGGFRNPERYFMVPPEGYDEQKAKEIAQGGEQDPKQAEAQEKARIREAEVAHANQMREAEFAHKRQMEEFDKLAAQRVKEAQINADLELAETQERIRERIKLVEIESNKEIQQLRIYHEDELARERLEREMQLAEQRQEDQKLLAERNIAAKTKGTNGFRPGGDLSK